MSERGPIDLGLGLLDHQLLDAEGRRCGKVDDLELAGVREGKPRVVAILSGPPAWAERGLLGRLARRLAGGRLVRIAWEDVESVDSGVRLRRRADEVGLGRGDDRARRLVERLPGAWR